MPRCVSVPVGLGRLGAQTEEVGHRKQAEDGADDRWDVPTGVVMDDPGIDQADPASPYLQDAPIAGHHILDPSRCWVRR